MTHARLAVASLLMLSAGSWAAPANLVVNGGFEEGQKGWGFTTPPGGPGRVALETDGPHTGKAAALLDATQVPYEVGLWSDPMPVQAGQRFHFTVWVRQTAGYGQYKAVLDWRDAGGKHLAYSNDWRGNNYPRRWAPHGGDFVTPPGAAQVVILAGVAAGSACLMDDFSLTPEPPEGPRLEAYLTSEPASPQGQVTIRAWIRNDGDRPSPPDSVALYCPFRAHPTLDLGEAVRPLPSLQPRERVRMEWLAHVSAHAQELPVRLSFTGETPVFGDPATTVFLPGGQVQTNAAPGVPTPRPVATKPLVGTYYFPVMLDWDRNDWGVRHVDYLTPALGYYDEALAEVADWHIKWAVEHGISFFAYDWYYNDGCLYIQDALEKGLLRAKHRSQMKFMINWCNEGQCTWDRPLNFSTESLCGFMEYLCQHYLTLPEYLRVNGRPVVMIIRPDPIIEWHGGPEGSRKALEAMRAVARRHGIPDLYFMCVALADRAPLYKAAGYDGISAYSYGWGDAPRYPNGDCDYDDLMPEHRSAWTSALKNAQAGGLGYMPVVWSGWDDYARAHQRVVRTLGNTPGVFREMCRMGKRYLDPSLNLLIIEAWNEWGEGGYLEPSVQRGFSFLDAIRDVFSGPGPHTDLLPSAAQRAGYETHVTCMDVDADYIRRDRIRQGTGPITRPAWAFDRDGDFRTWFRAFNVTGLRVAGGALQGLAANGDPALLGPEQMEVKAADWEAVEVRLKVTAGATVQLFWNTADWYDFTEEASEKLPLITDNQWHVYRLPVAANPRWRGVIRRLRLDPTDAAGATFAVAEIRGVPAH